MLFRVFNRENDDKHTYQVISKRRMGCCKWVYTIFACKLTFRQTQVISNIAYLPSGNLSQFAMVNHHRTKGSVFHSYGYRYVKLPEGVRRVYGVICIIDIIGFYPHSYGCSSHSSWVNHDISYSYQWPFQEPKLEVPIPYIRPIFHFSGLNFREYPHNSYGQKYVTNDVPPLNRILEISD